MALEYERRCPVHGILVGFRYCPECASSGKPWTEDQADDADRIAAVRRGDGRHNEQGLNDHCKPKEKYHGPIAQKANDR